MSRPAGMTDVARLAGVSHQTVSRVLNGHPSVRESTRERVLAAMAELHYRPNRLARALVTARSGLLGVVTSGSAKYGPMSTLLAIEEAARGSEYAVHVRAVRRGADEAPGTPPVAELDAALAGLDTQAVEAVVVIAPRVSVVEALADIDSRAPLVLVAAGVAPTERFDVVAVDQAAGARAATRHLLDLGHTRIAHLAGPSDWFDARERARGWREELAEAGLEPAAEWEGDWSAEAGYRLGLRLADDPDRPTAIVASNDQMALGLLRAFAERGVAVPGDVSVTGFDDIEGTGYFLPPLTTVRQDFEALAGLVMERVLVAVPGGDAASRTDGSAAGGPERAPTAPTTVPELVVRASTAPPRAG
ncbi:LacI family transcriptional regulator [Salana multivorans]|uniref:LacI family transcriptional regulator n=1 Tax=Salana multivorans TaxID=120377 RepID=A0A3N2DC51_9MICO|nr:LacI family DNA-binding transcriptional regulator [Salana multivorans]ROR97317.1 LacI family transcriptional regulator [Salana multivorans]